MSVEVPQSFPSDVAARENLLAYLLERGAADGVDMDADALSYADIKRLADKYMVDWLLLHRGD